GAGLGPPRARLEGGARRRPGTKVLVLGPIADAVELGGDPATGPRELRLRIGLARDGGIDDRPSAFLVLLAIALLEPLEFLDKGLARLLEILVGRGVVRRTGVLHVHLGRGSLGRQAEDLSQRPSLPLDDRLLGRGGEARDRIGRGRSLKGAHSISLRSEQSRRTLSSTSASFCMPIRAASTAESRGRRWRSSNLRRAESFQVASVIRHCSRSALSACFSRF